MAEKEHGAVSASGDESEVIYVVVVHGIGEQRKNETAIAVANRFAEARRATLEDDRRDVLTLGAVSQQTGTSMDPAELGKDEQPWMEFEGIPCATPLSGSKLRPFMGQASSTGANLRFVDLCWSDVLRTAYAEAGQPVDVWAQGLLGRLLRKHEGAKKCPHAKVPFWIRRTLYLLADGLLLTRKVMRFRFKEMGDLVFTKFLGDVQIYGEYSRCRGRAVRRFHDMMESIEKRHWEGEKSNGTSRSPRYVVIAHSLGSVMSFDALMYAGAVAKVRNGNVPSWYFPGYLESSSEQTGKAPCTDWISRVRSFVTLGSPIDKHLLIWWMNYRYLCTREYLNNSNAVEIQHFNYCDELDPVGHHLEVVSGTKAYQEVFKECEDTVFNRYGVPGVAHNAYWADQALWRWILARSVDGQSKCASAPTWFEKKAYRQLLRWLYVWVPITVVGGGYVALMLALKSSSWQTAVLAGAIFTVVLYFGWRLIDLAVWWRQIQRQEGEAARKRRKCWSESRVTTANCESEVNSGSQNQRDRMARWFRWRAAVWPFAMGLVGVMGVWLITSEFCQRNEADWPHFLEDPWFWRGMLFAGTVLTVLLFVVRGRLRSAYRTPASGEGGFRAECVAVLFGAVVVVIGVLGGMVYPWPVLRDSWAIVRGGAQNLTPLLVLASVVWAYRWRRFQIVRTTVGCKRGEVCYAKYAFE